MAVKKKTKHNKTNQITTGFECQRPAPGQSLDFCQEPRGGVTEKDKMSQHPHALQRSQVIHLGKDPESDELSQQINGQTNIIESFYYNDQMKMYVFFKCFTHYSLTRIDA